MVKNDYENKPSIKPAIVPGVSYRADGEPALEQDRLVQDDPEDPLLENFNEDFVDR